MPGKSQKIKHREQKRATRSSIGAKGGKSLYPTIHDLLKEAAKKLRPKKIACVADQDVGWLEAELLLAHLLKKDKSWIVAHGRDRLSLTLKPRFHALVKRRQKGEPIAYILGYKEFYGRPFKVNRHTLIPRPETELFIDVLKKRLKKSDAPLIWDVGTGCGEIAITAALAVPKAKVLASDICKRALKVTETNVRAYAVSKRIDLVQADGLDEAILERIHKSRAPLVITANLPYLPESDVKKLEKDVVNYEPHKALFSGKDGLDLIKQLLRDVDEKLNTLPKLILLEFDPPQSKQLRAFAKRLFPSAKIGVYKDLAKKHRLLEIRF